MPRRKHLIPNFQVDQWPWLLKQTWYHGTSLRNGLKILEQGEIRPNTRAAIGKYSADDPLRPLPGRVYVTTDLDTAVDYAIGARFHDIEHYGAGDRTDFLVILKAKISPDMDVWLDEDLAEALDAHVDDWLEKHPKARVRRGTRLETAKEILPHLTDREMQSWSKYVFERRGYVHLAVKGPVPVLDAWVLGKRVRMDMPYIISDDPTKKNDYYKRQFFPLAALISFYEGQFED
jgi:hypothetical protein